MMCATAPAAPLSHRAKGSSLVEVLVALAIMGIMMVGILQMFSLALVVNIGSGARTQLLFKCQQVVENVRFFYFLGRKFAPSPTPVLITGAAPGVGIPMAVPGTFPAPIGPVGKTYLPYESTDATWDYWGPLGANVMEQDKGPYKISYSIDRTSASARAVWVITVTAEPTDDTTATERFHGVGPGTKRVDYVAQFPNIP